MYDLSNSFPGQEKGEAIYVFARPYLLSFLPTSIIFLLLFLGQVATQYAASVGLIDLTSFGKTVLVLTLGATELFTIIVFTVALFDYYLDILIVSDRKVVDISQEQLFYREISELNLENVEDAKSVVKGFFQTFFDYGTVTIQTAGAEKNFVAHNFRHPRQIASIISDLSEQAKRRVPDTNRKPEGEVIGVIDGKTLTNIDELATAGGIAADDIRTTESDNSSRHW